MLTLAIDTASAACQACVHDSEAGMVAGAASEIIGRGHAERLMPVVDAALEAAHADISQLGRVAVTVGPGSFTGIRVGVSAARGLALALGCECLGIGSLEALAAAHYGRAGPILAVLDARRGEVYAALFEGDGRITVPPAAMTAQEAARLAGRTQARLTGSGSTLVAEFLPAAGRAGLVLSSADTVDMTALARLAAERTGPFDPPRPLYLRGADAKPQTGFAVARKA